MIARPTQRASSLRCITCMCVAAAAVGCYAHGDGPARAPDASTSAAGNAGSAMRHDAAAGSDTSDAALPDCHREGYTMDRDCDAPPDAECIDDKTLGYSEPLGRCVAMRCEYWSRPLPCFGGCSSRGCALCPFGDVVDPATVIRGSGLGWPERKCWPRAALRDPTHLPGLTSPSDAAVPELPDRCPDAGALEWGSISGEDCIDQPACATPLESTDTECCYVTYQACGV